MSCPTTKCLCDSLIITQNVTFANGVLTINIPEGAYKNGCKYCLVIAQEIPTTTTISANVVITIGANTTTYPLVNANCTNVNACQISYRQRYSTIVHTDIQSGVFKLTGPIGCRKCRYSTALPIPTTTTTTTDTGNETV